LKPYYKTENCALYQCDNLELMKFLPDNYVDLIYCDVLYGTGRIFEDYQDLKTDRKVIEHHYVPRIKEMHRILKNTGSIYLQMDSRINHWMRCILDEVFGYNNFVNEISWGYRTGGGTKKRWMPKTDKLEFYTKSENYNFNAQEEQIRQNRYYGHKSIREFKDENGWYRIGTARDFWQDIQPEVGQTNGKNTENKERIKYSSSKPIVLLERIVKASSNENDIVADFYMGSGTTAEASLKLNRKFIGCDIGDKACQISKERLMSI
jgi:site-specific DNA-methyltransferase (adenine-specific)